MTRAPLAFLTLAAILGVVFARLGFWQLDRLEERRLENALAVGRLTREPVPLPLPGADTARANRRAMASGTPDYGNEFVLTGRSRHGSPGVHVITPMRLPGRDTAVLVNRGWVYSPDASSVDLTGWREDRTSFAGYTQELVLAVTATPQGRAVRRLTVDAVRALLPYPVYPVYLVAQDSAPAAAPARLPPPALDEGPHLSYAVQWFSFAAIALIGGAVVVARSRRARPDGPLRVAGSTGA